jgi:hypothetical protein
MKTPPLPILKLKKENIGKFCNSWLQNKLSVVLWAGAENYKMQKVVQKEEF